MTTEEKNNQICEEIQNQEQKYGEERYDEDYTNYRDQEVNSLNANR